MSANHSSEPPHSNRKGHRRSLGLYAVLALLGLSAGVITARLVSEREEGTAERTQMQGEGFGQAALGIGGLYRLPVPRDVPDLSFTGTDGRTYSLSAWRGKAVLVNLWATWCAPCREEMPSLDRLQAKLGSDRFAVLAISTDRTGLERPAAFFAKEGIKNLALYNDKSSSALSAFHAAGLPFSLILDPQGREIALLVGPANWDSPEATAKLKELIGAPAG